MSEQWNVISFITLCYKWYNIVNWNYLFLVYLCWKSRKKLNLENAWKTLENFTNPVCKNQFYLPQATTVVNSSLQMRWPVCMSYCGIRRQNILRCAELILPKKKKIWFNTIWLKTSSSWLSLLCHFRLVTMQRLYSGITTPSASSRQVRWSQI